MEPPPSQNEGDSGLSEHLAACCSPITVLLWPPYTQLVANVSIGSFVLCASRFSAESMEVKVEQAEVWVQSFELQSWQGTFPDLCNEVWQFWLSQARVQLPWLITAISLNGQNLGNYTAGLLGCSLSLLRFGGARAGAVGHVLAHSAVAITSVAIASKEKGKELRGVDTSADYCLGDATSGFMALACARGRTVRGLDHDSECNDEGHAITVTDLALGSAAGIVDYVYEERLVPSTIGLVIGGMIGEVAGPVGALAGAT